MKYHHMIIPPELSNMDRYCCAFATECESEVSIARSISLTVKTPTNFIVYMQQLYNILHDFYAPQKARFYPFFR
jgi:hypothetical protein